MEKIYYDLNRDFAEMKMVAIEEVLTVEDLEEGLVPEIYDVGVALTSHVVERMYDTEDRDIEWEEIELLLLKLGDELLSLKNGEQFHIATTDSTISIIGNTHFQDGKLILIIHTIIRVQMRKKGGYKKIKVHHEGKNLIVGLD